LDIDKKIAESVIAYSISRKLDAQLIKSLCKAFDLKMMSAKALCEHSIRENYCISCAAPLSNLGRFTRHCTICGGINFDWSAVLHDC